MRPSHAPGPILLPKTPRAERRVFLDPSLWERLSDASSFHSEATAAAGGAGKITRNDLTETFLEWALQDFWTALGGPPTSASDRASKVKRLAAQLTKQGK